MILAADLRRRAGAGGRRLEHGSRAREAAEEVDRLFREILPDAAKKPARAEAASP